jgi:hypothetical protein
MSSMPPPPVPSSNGIAVAPSGVVGAPSGASVNGHVESTDVSANNTSMDGQVPSVPEITAVQGIVPTLQ